MRLLALPPAPCISLLLLIVVLAVASCRSGEDPQAIIDRAIDAHGGDMLEQSIVEFDLRGRHYRATMNDGLFTYERIYSDSIGHIHDVLTNDELYREVGGQRIELTERLRRSIASGVNSTIYFALLPYKLNDPAVQKRYLGEAIIDGVPYHEIEITFQQEGGGRDYEDRFVYWINQRTNTMDYLAYHFHTDGGGTRFRKAVNPRVIGGVRFADYLNYTTDSIGTAVEIYDSLKAAGNLRMLSEIVLENLSVRPVDE